MRNHAALLALALAGVAVARATAQSLEAFEVETFVDPESLSVRLADGTREDRSLVAAYLRLGVANDYQYRARFTGADATFADLTATWLHKRQQVTGRVTSLGDSSGDNGHRLEARFATYQLGSMLPAEGVRTISRWEAFAVRQEGTGLADGTTLGCRLDFSAVRGYQVVGGLTYAYYRPDSGPTKITDADVHFLSADFRTSILHRHAGFSLDLGGGVGATRQVGVNQWGTVRGEVRLKWRPNNDRWRFYAVYAPAWQIRSSPGRRINHELTVFAHVRLLTMLLPRHQGRTDGSGEPARP